MRCLAILFLGHVIVNDAKCIAMSGGKAHLSLYDHEKLY